MKVSTLFLLLLILTSTSSMAQEEASSEKLTQKNVINYGIGMGVSVNHNSVAIPSTYLEYNRRMTDRFYVGGYFGYGHYSGGFLKYDASNEQNPYRNSFNMNSYSLYAMAYYNFPVIDKRLSLRFGIGVGVGFNDVIQDSNSNYLPKSNVIPYIQLRAQWIIHITHSIDLLLSPFLIGPAHFEWSPMGFGAPPIYKKNILLTDFGHISVGFRF